MRLSLIISFLLHCSLLLAGVVILPSPEEYVVDLAKPIPVDILTISEFTKLRAQTPEPEPVVKPAPEEPKEVTPAPPREPEPELEVNTAETEQPAPLEPEVGREPEPKVEPKPEPEKVTETKPVPKPRRRPRAPKKKVEKKKEKFNPDRIAALLDKSPDAKPMPKPTPDNATPAPGLQTRLDGSDETVSQDEKDALRKQIERCWSPPIGVLDAGALVVRVRISLKRDGSLSTPPEVVNSNASPTFQIAAESAVRAIRRCQPFEMPANKYNIWRDIILNFNPKEMLQG